LRLTADQKLEAIELLCSEELDEEEREEQARGSRAAELNRGAGPARRTSWWDTMRRG
jgi:hypothetical protein